MSAPKIWSSKHFERNINIGEHLLAIDNKFEAFSFRIISK